MVKKVAKCVIGLVLSVAIVFGSVGVYANEKGSCYEVTQLFDLDRIDEDWLLFIYY